MKNEKRIGLALGSGGPRGLAHIGVIKVLLKNNIKIDIVAGSSAGSLVGSYFSLFGEVDSLEKLLLNNREELIQSFYDFSLKGGLIKGIKLKKYIEKTLKNSDFNDTKIPFISVSTDLISGQKVAIKDGKLTPAVFGSMTVPILFKPIKYKGGLLIDGGISDPVPISDLRNEKVSKVIAVNLYHVNEFINKKFTLATVAGRTIRIALYNLAKESVKDADIVITPDTSHIITNTKITDSLNPETIKAIIEIGEKEAQKYIKKIKELSN